MKTLDRYSKVSSFGVSIILFVKLSVEEFRCYFRKFVFLKNTFKTYFFLNYCVSDQAEYRNRLFNFILKFYEEHRMSELLFRSLDHFKTQENIF